MSRKLHRPGVGSIMWPWWRATSTPRSASTEMCWGWRSTSSPPPGELHGRHGAVRPGGESEQGGLHFFEYLQAPLFGPHDRTLQAAIFDPGATFLSHISLALPDEVGGLAPRARLTPDGVETTRIMDQGPIRNRGFIDNNGMSLEAAWPRGPVQIE